MATRKTASLVARAAAAARTTAASKAPKSTLAADVVMERQETATTTKNTSTLAIIAKRFIPTAEIAVSKLAPAGFGWQAGSILAEQAGLNSEQLGFFLATGAGDFVGVGVGHTTYMALKKAFVPSADINMTAEAQTGLLLASAAFCSGGIWQAALNQFTNAGCTFTQAAVGTGVVCGASFYGGLRAFRAIYSKAGLTHIEGPSYLNLRNDAQLSVAIGGASAAFVGTDVSFADNFLRPLVGVEEGMSNLAGCVTAGASTALGFTAIQGAKNLTLPAKKNWLDAERE